MSNNVSKMKATVNDLKSYDEMMSRLNMLDPEKDDNEWFEIGDKLSDFEASRDWFPTIFKEDGKEGLKDLDGTVMVPAIFDSIVLRFSRLHCRNNLPVIVVNDGRYGLARTDGTGKLVIPCEHDQIENVYGAPSLFMVADNKKIALYQNDGTILVPQTADSFDEPCNDIIVFKADGKYGLYDCAYNKYVEPLYEVMEVYPEETVKVTKDGVEGYLSLEDARFISKEEAEEEDFDELLISADINLPE